MSRFHELKVSMTKGTNKENIIREDDSLSATYTTLTQWKTSLESLQYNLFSNEVAWKAVLGSYTSLEAVGASILAPHDVDAHSCLKDLSNAQSRLESPPSGVEPHSNAVQRMHNAKNEIAELRTRISNTLALHDKRVETIRQFKYYDTKTKQMELSGTKRRNPPTAKDVERLNRNHKKVQEVSTEVSTITTQIHVQMEQLDVDRLAVADRAISALILMQRQIFDSNPVRDAVLKADKVGIGKRVRGEHRPRISERPYSAPAPAPASAQAVTPMAPHQQAQQPPPPAPVAIPGQPAPSPAPQPQHPPPVVPTSAGYQHGQPHASATYSQGYTTNAMPQNYSAQSPTLHWPSEMRTADPFQSFFFSSSISPSILPPIEPQVIECLKHLQRDIPTIHSPSTKIPPVIISALLSVNAWPYERPTQSDYHLFHPEDLPVTTRNRILQIGSATWSDPDNPVARVPLANCWRRDVVIKSGFCLSDIRQYRWICDLPPTDLVPVDDLNLTVPRDGPPEVWSRESVGALSGRRIVLSYVHDPNAETQVVWQGEEDQRRRSVRLTQTEATQASRPQFLSSVQCMLLGHLWHDGMKYPTPDGKRNGYAGVVPYMLPGSAVWHSVPRLRKGYGYPSLGNSQLDSILNSFAELRSGKRGLVGIDNVEIEFAEDRPYRDLSGVRRLWLIAEATCGMLRDDLIISVQDMAGVALTLMHYDNLVSELNSVIEYHSHDSTIEWKRTIPCFGRPQRSSTWAKLCTVGEGSHVILKQTLANAGLDQGQISSFEYATRVFDAKVRLLKFWYALMLGKGSITSLPDLRFEILEDLAVAPAYEREDRAMVYFMVEAAVINRLERQIPYEESVRRFLRAENGGKLLLDSVNLRSERVVMEMTRVQLERMIIYNWAAALRQPGWRPTNMALRATWLSPDSHVGPSCPDRSGQEGPSYLGRFTTSMSKQLYIKAARSWAGHSDEVIVRTATEGKSRMLILLSDKHRLNRYIDADSKTEIIVCSIFYMDEDEYNLALSQFGNHHFHAEERMFTGKTSLTDTEGKAVQWDKTLTTLCAVDRKGRWVQLPSQQRLYQIVVTSKIGSKDGHLAAIRIACNGTGREPVAVSPADILSHMTGEVGHKLFQMRPDQVSPDGVNIVDYSFEYEMFWADSDGTTRSTVAADASTIVDVVDNMISSLRTKHWR